MKKRLLLPTATVAAVSLAAALVAPTTASASGTGATVTPFSVTSTETFQGSLPECFTAGLSGTNVLTDTATGQVVKTSSGIFTVHGTDVVDYRVDFPNGMYALGRAISHFSFTGSTWLSVSSDVIREPRTIYAADGTPVITVVIHALSHVTGRDQNMDGILQPEEISANVDHFFFTCH